MVHPSEGAVVNYTLLTPDYREHLKLPPDREAGQQTSKKVVIRTQAC